jgi:20S proteasome alpha/beta subunit
MSLTEAAGRAKHAEEAFSVTIIIGIKCQDGIFVACDSRTSDGVGRFKDDAVKLHKLATSDGNAAIVARAGNDSVSARIVEDMEELVKTKALETRRSFAECAEKASEMAMARLRNHHKGASADELKRLVDDQSCELMIAHYFKGDPYLFSLNFWSGTADLQPRNYLSIGCGSDLADFLIGRLKVDEFKINHAVWTSVYAIEEIKRVDYRCGGLTRNAFIKNRNGLSSVEVSSEKANIDAVTAANEFSLHEIERWRKLAEEQIDLYIKKRDAKTKR